MVCWKDTAFSRTPAHSVRTILLLQMEMPTEVLFYFQLFGNGYILQKQTQDTFTHQAHVSVRLLLDFLHVKKHQMVDLKDRLIKDE